MKEKPKCRFEEEGHLYRIDGRIVPSVLVDTLETLIQTAESMADCITQEFWNADPFQDEIKEAKEILSEIKTKSGD